MVHLGPFEIRAAAGRGGMAEVFRGRHGQSGEPVAVKVLKAAHARDPRYRAFFRNEVRAVAGLDHPHVIAVYDMGEVEPTAAEASEGRLVEGEPYLVMEWASGGSLARHRVFGYRELTQILLALLDALAHSHARGVIHRDIKPANVLMTGPDAPRPGLKLADFGIARRPEDAAASDTTTGTPAYMAPEQALGHSRRQGPWTDLYSVGCLAFRLATGSPPFRGDSRDVIAAHLSAPMPEIGARYAVPPGFDEWVERLMQKDPAARFGRAADAAAALLRLGAPGPEGVQAAAGPREAASEEPLTTLEFATVTETQAPRDLPSPDREPVAVARRFRADPPELPADWRLPKLPGPPRLHGAGLGLFGLRAVPLVDRDRERDLLWGALGRVVAGGRAASVLRGPAGAGKSRLASWLCERAHEVGAATVLRAIHSPAGGPADGPGPMLARHLSAVGLTTRPELVSWIAEHLSPLGITDPADWEAVAELCVPAPETERRVRFRDPPERHALLMRVLRAIGHERPVLLWMDDVQWGIESLGLALHLMSAPAADAPRLLLLLTARVEDLEGRTQETARLRELAGLAGVHVQDVGPLSAEDCRSLAGRSLGLEDPLVDAVAERAAGSPLFALSLIGHCVERGALVPTPDGFRLAPGVELELPDDLHALLRARVEGVLTGRSSDEVMTLELAAALGMDVSGAEWREVCTLAGTVAADALLDELLNQGLVRASREGPAVAWHFAHGLLRDSVLRRSGEAGRLPQQHQLCATMLAARDPAPQDRVGRHLVQAGELEAALDPLLGGAVERLSTGDLDLARSLLTERNEVLDRLGVASLDPRRASGARWLARAERRAGRFDSAAEWAERGLRSARSAPDEPAGLAAVLLEAGLVLHSKGQLARARAELVRAVSAARSGGDSGLLAECLQALGGVLCALSELDPAEAAYREALAQPGVDPVQAAIATRGLGLVHRARGDLEEADRLLTASHDRFAALGDRWAVAGSELSLGDVARDRGEHARAEELYRRAADRYQRMGAAHADHALLFVGVLLKETGRPDEAARVLTRVRQGAGARGMGAVVAFADVALLAVSAEQAAPGKVADALERVRAELAATSLVHPDIAAMLTGAGRRLLATGSGDSGRAVLELALAQWRALHRDEDAAAVETLLTGARG